jgi:hypothetical protein
MEVGDVLDVTPGVLVGRWVAQYPSNKNRGLLEAPQVFPCLPVHETPRQVTTIEALPSPPATLLTN